ncbi:MAG: PorV/PorQ family protein [bacterium]
MKKILLSVLVLFTFSFIIAADTTETFQNSSNLAAKYLDINVGAQAAGMGNAFIGASTGSASIFWNPAGLASLKTSEKTWNAFISHNFWLADMTNDHLAVAAQFNKYGVLAFGFSYFGFGTMDEYTLDGSGLPVKTGKAFSPYALLTSLSYANKLDTNIDFGITLKYLHDEIAGDAAQALGLFDVGIRYFSPLKGLSFDLLAKNFGPKLNGLSVTRELSLSSFYTTTFEGGWGLAVDGDICAQVNADPLYKLGVEIQTPYIVILRTGYHTDHTGLTDGIKNFSLGAGIKVDGKYIDFAWEPYSTLGNAYKISIGGDF